MKSRFSSERSPSDSGPRRAFLGVAVAVVSLASLAVLGLTLGGRAALDVRVMTLRRENLTRSFYLTKVLSQAALILEYEPVTDAESVATDLERRSTPLFTHMTMVFSPEREAELSQALGAGGMGAGRLRSAARTMWEQYGTVRDLLRAAIKTEDASLQRDYVAAGKRELRSLVAALRLYNNSLFMTQTDVLSSIENQLVRSHRTALVSAGLGAVAAGLLVLGLVSWLVRERRHRSALVASRQAAESANAAKDVFLATVSHELRTPLHGIFGLLELVGDTDLGHDQRRYLSLIRTTAGSLLQNVNELLDLSAIESGRLTIDRKAVVVRSAVGSAVEIARLRAQEKGLEFRIIWPDHETRRLVDPGRLAQIVTNLTSNAVKYTEAGHVEIEFEERSRHLRIVVRDTGRGIDPGQQERVFELFVQLDAGLTRTESGVGAGLAIVQRLVDAMGGTIVLASEPGLGTTFEVVIPAPPVGGPVAEGEPVVGRGADASHHDTVDFGNTEADRHDAATLGDAVAAASDERAVRLLIAEDEAINRLHLRMTLEKAGYQVSEAATGPEALDLLRGERFAAALLDISMPGMSGLDVVRQVRADEAASDGVPAVLIALTAHARPEDREECLRAGFNGFLSKPFDSHTLLEMVARMATGERTHTH